PALPPTGKGSRPRPRRRASLGQGGPETLRPHLARRAVRGGSQVRGGCEKGDTNPHGLSGHRILRLLAPRTEPASTCRPVSSGVVPCRSVSACREQDVGKEVVAT